MLDLRDVEVAYGNIRALKGISLTVAEGELVTLIGANGAGKSTTLKTISGLLRPKAGVILYQDQTLDRVDFSVLHERLGQNGTQEKLTALWIDRALRQTGERV